MMIQVQSVRIDPWLASKDRLLVTSSERERERERPHGEALAFAARFQNKEFQTPSFICCLSSFA
jgi:hypothetical protein